ncbi:MAG: BREX system P-loop protein BrxC, partial [Persicimonas sp.]
MNYCSTSPTVAEYELKLERDGHWDDFLAVVDEQLGKPWEEARDEEMAEDVFSRMMHHLFPENFATPTAWFESRIGLSTNWSPNEATDAIGDMLEHRAPNKGDKPRTLFIVIDEVSQYIHQDDQRMLRLQSFVSALGQRLQGKVWLLVTGQEKLEEESESTVLGKLKGRFKPRLRVHLDATNIRDVVHKRLLQKTADAADELGELFQEFRHNLKLYAHKCQSVTEEEFTEVYPLLPAHIDLLMEITSAMRTRSTRVQGDTHAIRGLIQLLGELFREKELAERPVGTLITFDDIYDVQESALDVDTQNTMTKIRNWYSETADEEALRVAKVVALLQLIQDTQPTTAEFVARCLYDRLDRGDNTDEVESALERLRKENLVSYSEKHGYKLQSSAGQEWAAERDKISLTSEDLSERVQDQLQKLIAETDMPRLKGTSMSWNAWFTDNRGHEDVSLRSVRGKASVPVDFRYVGAGERSIAEWTRRSGQHNLKDRILWIVGEAKKVDDAAREWGKSQRMIQRYDTRRESLSADKQRLLIEERQREEQLRKHVRDSIEDAFMQGAVYFRGQDIAPRDKGGSFRTALHRIGADLLPELYPHYTAETVTESELKQLLTDSLAGATPKFMEEGLGILRLDNGRYEAHCGGSIPAQIERTIEETSGINGSTLFAKFTDQPYGYHPSLVQAALAGLLRGRKITVEPEGQSRITSYKDPGTQTLFTKISELRRADYYPAGERSISPRDRVKIRQLFEKRLGLSIAPEEEAIADAVYRAFPGKAKELSRVRRKLSKLPGERGLPEALAQLERALDACRTSRRIEKTVERVKQHYDILNDGFQQLGIYAQELNDEAIEQVIELHDVYEHHYRQLDQSDALTEDVRTAGERIDEQLGRRKPWNEAISLTTDLDT